MIETKEYVAYERMLNGDVHYRFDNDMASL